MSQEIKEIADKLVTRLKAQGFIVQGYEAMSTNSIYLKLDYGVANSIRISDHKGKKHLDYRYNVLTTQKKKMEQMSGKGFRRYYYPPSMLTAMLRDICKHKQEKLEKYGKDSYDYFMKKNIETGENKAGFWAQAKLL